MSVYTIDGIPVSKESQDKIDNFVYGSLRKQGFSSMEDYGLFYGYKSGKDVLKANNIRIHEINE